MTLLGHAARATLIVLFALAVRALLRQRGTATSRHLALVLAMLAMLLEPLIALLVPTWRVSLPLGAEDSCALTGPGWALLAIWAVGVIVVVCKHVSAYRRAAAVSARTTELREPGWKSVVQEAAKGAGAAPPEVRVSDELGGPVVAGIWRPVVLLPRAALDWAPARARMTLLHELAHVLRRDGLAQLLAHAVTALYWFNPLAWYAAAQLRHERELAADERVLQLGATASDYAEHLVTVARELAAPPPQGLLAMASRSRLGERVENVLTFDSACRVRTLGRIAIVVSVCVASFAVSSLHPSAAPSELVCR